MRKVALWVALVGLGLAGARAAPPAEPLASLSELRPPAILFDVSPAEAELVMFLGVGSYRAARTREGRYILERPRSNLGKSDSLRCEFQSEGYLPFALTLKWADILEWNSKPGGHCPTPIHLRPVSARAYLQTYPWLGLSALAPALLGWLIFNWRSKRIDLVLLRRVQEMVTDRERQADPLLGLALGNYRLISRLGSGGMASVYKALPAQSLQESEAVAIKVIRLDAEDPESRTRFEKEIAVTIRLDHPNIVRVLEWGWEAQRPYLVMEWLDGGSLSQRIVPGGMALSEVISLLRPLFAAVSHAHGRQVAHRDIKPENVLLTRTGLLKLMDFGLARSQQNVTNSAVGMAGTPGYMAPEQLLPDHGTQYFAADQYALAVTAYQMLCGRRPFENEEVFGLIRQQLEEEPPSILEFRPELGPQVDAVLQRMLARLPEDRFPEVASAGQALLEALVANPEALRPTWVPGHGCATG